MSLEVVCQIETLLRLLSVTLASLNSLIARDCVIFERIAVFCMTWSIAGRLTDVDRLVFDTFMRTLTPELPEKASCASNTSLITMLYAFET